jgi:hypothetical protein
LNTQEQVRAITIDVDHDVHISDIIDLLNENKIPMYNFAVGNKVNRRLHFTWFLENPVSTSLKSSKKAIFLLKLAIQKLNLVLGGDINFINRLIKNPNGIANNIDNGRPVVCQEYQDILENNDVNNRFAYITFVGNLKPVSLSDLIKGCDNYIQDNDIKSSVIFNSKLKDDFNKIMDSRNKEIFDRVRTACYRKQEKDLGAILFLCEEVNHKFHNSEKGCISKNEVKQIARSIQKFMASKYKSKSTKEKKVTISESEFQAIKRTNCLKIAKERRKTVTKQVSKLKRLLKSNDKMTVKKVSEMLKVSPNTACKYLQLAKK